MNLSSIKTIKDILEQYGAKPSKGMGQNFLVNQQILEKIIATAHINKDDTILEIGPGIGTLTQELAKRAKKVIAIEKDKRMVEIIQETLKEYENIEVIEENILTISGEELPSPYKIVANIPYYLTSPLIRKFLEMENPPEVMVLMIQKEVAQRICAQPPEMSLLAVSVQFYAKPEIISYVKKENFWPIPNVDSAIIKITPFRKTKDVDPQLFFNIVKAGFSQPRKQLLNNLSKSLKKDRKYIKKWLLKNSIAPEQRAETLSVKQCKDLTKTFNAVK